jgi:ABC-type dipeptide/oligopeptide/nickel transport system permease subunit
MTAPLEISPTKVGVAEDGHSEGTSGITVEGRSLGRIAWLRLRRDKLAMAGGVVVVLLCLVALIGPHLVGSPLAYHSNLINPNLSTPNGPWGGISLAHPLGIEPVTGRDLLARVVNGAKWSLLIALLATILSVGIGVVMGIFSGYVGGWVDSLIARAMDVFLAFPLLVFAIALIGVIPATSAHFGPFQASGLALRVGLLIFIIGFFNWPYMGRIIRGQTLSLREREFVDAARSIGGRTPYILFREILPNLVGPILVYSTLLIPTNILFEAALSYLGVGIQPPTPTWGGMLSDAVTNEWYSIDPLAMLVPGVAIFITVIAFNLFGDGLRDALDPKSR